MTTMTKLSMSTEYWPGRDVEGNDGLAKFWLRPVSLAENVGYSPRELQRIRMVVERDRAFLIQAIDGLRASMAMTPPTIKAIRAIDDRLIFELDQDREVSLSISASAPP